MLSQDFVNKLCKEIKKGAPIQLACTFFGISWPKLRQHIAAGELTLDSGKLKENYTTYEELCVQLYERTGQEVWGFVGKSLEKLYKSDDTKAHIWIMEKYLPKVFGKAAEVPADAQQQTPPLIINKQPQGAGNVGSSEKL